MEIVASQGSWRGWAGWCTRKHLLWPPHTAHTPRSAPTFPASVSQPRSNQGWAQARSDPGERPRCLQRWWPLYIRQEADGGRRPGVQFLHNHLAVTRALSRELLFLVIYGGSKHIPLEVIMKKVIKNNVLPKLSHRIFISLCSARKLKWAISYQGYRVSCSL